MENNGISFAWIRLYLLIEIILPDAAKIIFGPDCIEKYANQGKKEKKYNIFQLSTDLIFIDYFETQMYSAGFSLSFSTKKKRRHSYLSIKQAFKNDRQKRGNFQLNYLSIHSWQLCKQDKSLLSVST